MLGQAALGRLFYYLTLDKVKSCGILGIRKFVEELAMQYKKMVEVDSSTYADLTSLSIGLIDRKPKQKSNSILRLTFISI
jgi:hypothetical protein